MSLKPERRFEATPPHCHHELLFARLVKPTLEILVVHAGGPEYEVREFAPHHPGHRGRLLATFLGQDAFSEACSWIHEQRSQSDPVSLPH